MADQASYEADTLTAGLTPSPTSATTHAGGQPQATKPTTEKPRQTRRKIALACTPCRERKSRCNGERPACLPCRKRHREHLCTWEESKFVNSADQNASVEQGGRGRTDLNLDGQVQHNPSSVTSAHVETLPASTPSDNSNHQGSSARAITEAVIQTMDLMVSPQGSSRTSGKMSDASPKSSFRDSYRKWDTSSNHGFGLPMRSTADKYTTYFFKYVLSIFPVLHWPSFQARYFKVWTGDVDDDGGDDDLDKHIFMATLYMVFALGCMYSDMSPTKDKACLANQFYIRSTEVIAVEALDTIPLEGIQLLLLQTIHLQSTKHENRWWNIAGIATRGAVSLGLNLPFNGSYSRRNQLQREMRRRAWHTCVIFDRLLALNLGRPMMVGSINDFPLPQAVDDEYLLEDGEGVQPAHQESRIILFIHCIKLFEIQRDTLLALYTKEASIKLSGKLHLSGWSEHWLSELLKINHSLEEVEEALPDQLRLTPLADHHEHGRFQSNVFNGRFLYIRALLLRPVLLLVARLGREIDLSSSQTTSLEMDIMKRICAHCILTVTALVNLKYQTISDPCAGPPWPNSHYIFVSAVILAAARLCPAFDPALDHDVLRSAWDRCITVLEHYAPQIEAADSFLHTVSLLGRRIHDMEQPSSNTRDGENNTSSEEPILIQTPSQNAQMENQDYFGDGIYDFLQKDLDMLGKVDFSLLPDDTMDMADFYVPS
ncbi:hypothetical protein H2204_001086 [Knufia peltigerae]|uniref:Zn(2)-C6 fungal-type domain-containing protein n=1 Tax=Knufia peltigerae TaxID=1002370 RepID=A0AA38YDL8_9EURO|nr:hypothetical protein H2204_001086 [Knufia peltigerae]